MIIAQLDKGPTAAPVSKLVIPEGYRTTEIADRVTTVGMNRAAYLAAVTAAPFPPGFGHHRIHEGFLFPATYDVKRNERPSELVAEQMAAFEEAFSQVDMSYAESKNLTPYDVLTIASMIEREARVDSERKLIAAVIYNRLHLHMPLGIDATLLYEQGSWTHKLTVSELARRHAVQHAREPRAAADADLQPGARVAAGGGAPGERRLPVLRRQG